MRRLGARLVLPKQSISQLDRSVSPSVCANSSPCSAPSATRSSSITLARFAAPPAIKEPEISCDKMTHLVTPFVALDQPQDADVLLEFPAYSVEFQMDI